MAMYRFLSCFVGVGLVGTLLLYPGAAAERAAGRRHALVIACSKYDDLPAAELAGPENDARLFVRTLHNCFQWQVDEVIVLGEGAGAGRPTYANICRAFEQLLKRAGENDEVVVHLSGHGSRQADRSLQDASGRQIGLDELDGLDEVFLAADARRAEGRSTMFENVVTDDQLHEWIAGLAEKGARVWLIADCCHSGTILRGTESEVVRRLDPEFFFGKEVNSRAHRSAASPELVATVAAERRLRRVAVLYASLADEPTVETRFADDTGRPQAFGLLTYTLCRVLHESQQTGPMTYRELARRIAADYVRQGRAFPTPSIDGEDGDREVLGRRESKPTVGFRLSRRGDTWTMAAGSLHGVAGGNVLTVYPYGDFTDVASPLGYVRATRVALATSEVEPCAFGATDRVETLPSPALCRPLSFDFGSMQLRLYFSSEARRSALLARFRASAVPASIVGELGGADWQVFEEEGKPFLCPASGVVDGPPGRVTVFGPFENDDDLIAAVQRVARGTILTRVATMSPPLSTNGRRFGFKLDLLRHDVETAPGAPVVCDPGFTLHSGDLVSFQVTNTGRIPIAVTLLYVDPAYGIHVLYDSPGEAIVAGQSRRSALRRVTPDPEGTEWIVALAVRADRQNEVNFAALAQPTLPPARSLSQNPPGYAPFTHPLEAIFQSPLFAMRRTRGLDTALVEESGISCLRFKTQSRK